MNRRRTVLGLLAGTLACGLGARAADESPDRPKRVAWIQGDPRWPFVRVFRAQLAARGFIESENLLFRTFPVIDKSGLPFGQTDPAAWKKAISEALEWKADVLEVRGPNGTKPDRHHDSPVDSRPCRRGDRIRGSVGAAGVNTPHPGSPIVREPSAQSFADTGWAAA